MGCVDTEGDRLCSFGWEGIFWPSVYTTEPIAPTTRSTAHINAHCQTKGVGDRTNTISKALLGRTYAQC